LPALPPAVGFSFASGFFSVPFFAGLSSFFLLPSSAFAPGCWATGSFHSRTVLSRLPDRPSVPSDETATPHTQLVWPKKRHSSLPLSTSHSRTVWSELPDRTRLRPGVRTVPSNCCVCPSSFRSLPVLNSKTRSALSMQPARTNLPPGENAPLETPDVWSGNGPKGPSPPGAMSPEPPYTSGL